MMELFISVMSITGFIVWILGFAWAAGTIADKFGLCK